MFTPESDWAPPNLSELPSWKGQKRVGFDTEFKDATLRKYGCGARRSGTYVAGYSFAFQDGRKFYVPLRHPEGNVDLIQGLRYLKDQATEFDGELVGANLPIDLDMVNNDKTLPIEFKKVSRYRDILVADPLIYELNFGYGLEDVALRRGFEGKDETLLKRAAQDYGADISKETWKAIVPDLPSKYVGPYGEHDAFLPLQILEVQDQLIDQAGIRECWDLESDLLPILLKLRQRGVRIDFDHLDKVERWAHAQEREALDKIYHATNVRIFPGDTMKAKACMPAFEAIGIQVPLTRDPKTKKIRPSLDQHFVASIKHPVAEAFLHARKMYKLYSTFVQSVRDYSTNGRLHTTFRQIIGANEKNEKSGAAFGRLSSANPNLQQQPSRSKFANFWRQIYLAEPGTRWGCLDFSQQEPRWTTHFAARLGLKGAAEAAKAYQLNPRIDNHQFMADLTGLKRSYAKEVFLGLCYGEGGAKLCQHHLKMPTRWCLRYRESGETVFFDTKWEAVKARKEYEGEASYYEVAGEEGQKILDRFNEYAPYVRELAKAAEHKARKLGIVKVLGGRIIHFPEKSNGEYDWSYKALNRVIQGTSGMQVKMALIAIHREMPECFIQLQVHDELDGSFENVAQMKRVAKIMREVAGPTHVPFRIDIEEGENWGSLKLICGNDNCTRHAVKDNPHDEKDDKKFYCEEHLLQAA